MNKLNSVKRGQTSVSCHQKNFKKHFGFHFNEARDDGWQWHQMEHVQIICTLLQTDNHASTSSIFYRPDALPNAQPTVSQYWRQKCPPPSPRNKTKQYQERTETEQISHSIKYDYYYHFTDILRTTCVPQLRTRGFSWSKGLLPSCPCWWQLVHLD